MSIRLTRRTVALGLALAPLAHGARVSAQTVEPAFSLPIGEPDSVLGDGFFLRHGYATENTWYNPGWWHTAEDWYRLEGDTAGATVYANADGVVVFAGSDYPGRVVIIQHADMLYSMYGHLDFALDIAEGDAVVRGQRLGVVYSRTDGRAPSHLHFEVRTFLTATEVNGDAPRYAVGCGYQCPPGPGYWPFDAPEHPSAMGWRNPTHAIAARAYPNGIADGAEVVVARGGGPSTMLWTLPSDRRDAAPVGEITLTPGDRYSLRGVAYGREESERTSAEAYRLWYRIAAPELGAGWAQAAVPSSNDAGSDGRPSSIRFDLLPALPAGA